MTGKICIFVFAVVGAAAVLCAVRFWGSPMASLSSFVAGAAFGLTATYASWQGVWDA